MSETTHPKATTAAAEPAASVHVDASVGVDGSVGVGASTGLGPSEGNGSSAVSLGSPPQVLVAATEAVAGLVVTLWAARPPAELLDTVRAIEELRSVLDAVLLEVVVEVDAQGAARTDEWASTKDYLTAVTGGRRGEGRRLLALAQALHADRVGTSAALATGQISRAQAEAVCFVIDRLPVSPALRTAAEDLLLEEARTRDAGELATLGRYVLERLDPEGSEQRDEQALERQERAAHAGRFLSLTPDGIGGVRLRGRGTIEDAARITAVLAPLAAPHPSSVPGACGGTPSGTSTSPDTGEGAAGGGMDEVARESADEGVAGGRVRRTCGVADCAHDGRDPREHGTRMWDALVQAARLLADTDVLPHGHGSSARIGVTIDLDALTTSLGQGTLDTGGSLSAAAVRTLACDAEILPVVLGSASQLLDVGRTSRLVTPSLWLALIVRDQHCAFPGCHRSPHACDAHHIVHWANGGSTALHNLVLLCRTHHTLVHTTGWDIDLHPTDQLPDFYPPLTLDPHRRPVRRRPLRSHPNRSHLDRRDLDLDRGDLDRGDPDCAGPDRSPERGSPRRE